MDSEDVRRELKILMVSELNLEGKAPTDIDDAAPLFGEGLGLDSLDALQLAMSVEERFGVRIPEGDEARPIFASVNALVDHIVRAKAA
jgi:acyl carrier protein